MLRGPQAVTEMIEGTSAWLEAQGYSSISQARGKMSAGASSNAAVYERAQYLEVIKGEW